MDNLNFQDIVDALGPNSPPGIAWNILIYIVFFFTLITLLVQGDKALLTTIISAAALLLDVIAKLQIFPPDEFGAFVVNAGVFIFPGLVAGMAKTGRSRAPAILAALFGAVWFFAYWFFFQRGA